MLDERNDDMAKFLEIPVPHTHWINEMDEDKKTELIDKVSEKAFKLKHFQNYLLELISPDKADFALLQKEL